MQWREVCTSHHCISRKGSHALNGVHRRAPPSKPNWVSAKSGPSGFFPNFVFIAAGRISDIAVAGLLLAVLDVLCCMYVYVYVFWLLSMCYWINYNKCFLIYLFYKIGTSFTLLKYWLYLFVYYTHVLSVTCRTNKRPVAIHWAQTETDALLKNFYW